MKGRGIFSQGNREYAWGISAFNLIKDTKCLKPLEKLNSNPLHIYLGFLNDKRKLLYKETSQEMTRTLGIANNLCHHFISEY